MLARQEQPVLAQRLVHRDGHRVGQSCANARPRRGNADHVAGALLQQLAGKPTLSLPNTSTSPSSNSTSR